MNSGRVVRLARRELSALTAEKTLVLALVVQLFVAACAVRPLVDGRR